MCFSKKKKCFWHLIFPVHHTNTGRKNGKTNDELEVIHERWHSLKGSMPFTNWTQKLCLRCLLPQFEHCTNPAKVGRLMECVYCLLHEDPDPARQAVGENLFQFAKAMHMALGTASAQRDLWKDATYNKLMAEGWYAILRFAES